jgi:hypothetical protein
MVTFSCDNSTFSPIVGFFNGDDFGWNDGNGGGES